MKANSSAVRTLTASGIIALAGALALSSCTKKESAPESSAAPQAQAASPAAAVSPAAAASGAPAAASATAQAELTLGSDGDNLYFDKKEMEAKAGQTVKVTFKNNASAASNMNHNWVLVKPGTEQQVSTDSMQAGEAKDWVAEGPNVIAHTKLTKPGDTVSVTFTAPAAGDYPYICTFPGHSMTMKGVLHVK
jgi:azurin